MKLIGITGYTDEKTNGLNIAYTKAFTNFNCIPLIIPVLHLNSMENLTFDKFTSLYIDHIDKIVESLDAIIFSGGADLNPIAYPHPEENWGSSGTNTLRDMTERLLLSRAMFHNKPVMGICRGMQLIGLELGLDFWQQDLSETIELHSGTQRGITLRQESTHSVQLFGKFRDFMLGAKENGSHMNVNSWHHQGFTFSSSGKPIGAKIASINSDTVEEKSRVNILACTASVIEAFEAKDRPIFCVQWHPEEYGPHSKTIEYFLKMPGA